MVILNPQLLTRSAPLFMTYRVCLRPSTVSIKLFWLLLSRIKEKVVKRRICHIFYGVACFTNLFEQHFSVAPFQQHMSGKKTCGQNYLSRFSLRLHLNYSKLLPKYSTQLGTKAMVNFKVKNQPKLMI